MIILYNIFSLIFNNSIHNIFSYFIIFQNLHMRYTCPVAYPGIFFGGGGSTNSVEGRGSGVWGQ
jgi:hypothetical protein